MFDQATSMGDGIAEDRNHCGSNALCRERGRDSRPHPARMDTINF